MTWQRACSLKELDSGEIKKIIVDGVEILLIGHEGGVTAIPPTCPHLAEPLESSGLCDGIVLTCMTHLWQWEVDTGRPVGLAECPLLLYHTEVRDGDVYVHLLEELDYPR